MNKNMHTAEFLNGTTYTLHDTFTFAPYKIINCKSQKIVHKLKLRIDLEPYITDITK